MNVQTPHGPNTVPLPSATGTSSLPSPGTGEGGGVDAEHRQQDVRAKRSTVRRMRDSGLATGAEFSASPSPVVGTPIGLATPSSPVPGEDSEAQTGGDTRRGWCPGALTPMETGDGWLLRVRPRGGRYTLDQLDAIASAAELCGNGAIDLTNRANLQVRGLTQATIARAQAILADAGLIDGDASTEAVRNVIVAPLAGLDPEGFDVRALGSALETALAADALLHELPGKFGFAVDGGGAYSLRVGIADIVLRVTPTGTMLELAGAPGLCAATALATAVSDMTKLAKAFLALATADARIRRMSGAVRAVGAEAVFAAAGLTAREVPAGAARPGSLTAVALPIGALGPAQSPWALGIGLPYGRVTASALHRLADLAHASGIADIRPSPGRVLVLPLDGAAVAPLVAAAEAARLITDARDPRLAMDACPGAPACARGTTPTRDDADTLAALLHTMPQPAPQVPRSIHVSGCAKGCARPRTAELTLVARNGAYDIIQHGTTADTPVRIGVARDGLAAAIVALAGGPRG